MVRGINDGSIVINKGRYKTAFNKLAKNAFNEKTGCRMLEAFKRNMTLMNLIDTKFPPSEIEKIKGARDLKAFELLCHELNFRSFWKIWTCSFCLLRGTADVEITHQRQYDHAYDAG